MQPERRPHPFMIGVIIGLFWGLFRYPGALLGCGLILLLFAIVAVVVAWFIFVAWLPWSALALVGGIALWVFLRSRERTTVADQGPWEP